ncbi:hypothetical protein JKP88DRAFT_168703 [Tribonema minus]|uniref:NAD(P)-binding domain-containing protein n=1 Tax=Tribonema minus TaxID=303371 RepID=A0A836CB01_9STRA|nr:hypothetical protein JKP88DRAFT_168703 [Tribonema minus]
MEKLVIFGSTGAVGRLCVLHAVQDPRVEKVVAVVRSAPKPPAFFTAGAADPAAAAALLGAKLQQVRADFGDDASLRGACDGATAGLSCVGVYTAAVKDTADFLAREHAPNVAAARAAAAAGSVTRWGYLSGQGVAPPPPSRAAPGLLQPMFAFVKGSVERDVAAMGAFTRGVTFARPGMILGRGDALPGLVGASERFFNGAAGSWIARTRFAVQADDIARALVQSVLAGTGAAARGEGRGAEVLENEDIKRRAGELGQV